MVTEETFDVFEIVINSLAFSLLNSVPYEEPSQVEAIDDIGLWIRRGSLAIALSIDRLARAIEASNQESNPEDRDA